MRAAAIVLCAVAVVLAVAAVHVHASNNTPIVGVLSVGPDGGTCDTVTEWLADRVPRVRAAAKRAQAAARHRHRNLAVGHKGGDNGCFQGAYVKWLESGGARVVPIPYNSSPAQLDFLFSSVNGILFTGGGLSLDANTTYFQTAQYLFNKVLAANDAGDYFPLWGTCMGFQLLNILAAQDHTVLTENAFASENISLPLDFTPAAASSRLYGNAPEAVIDTLTNEKCTINFHHDGVEPSVFAAHPKLTSFFDVLSTNVDTKGKEFISSVEAKRYPIYGVQYHPERVQFEFWGALVPSAIDHTPESEAVGQYLTTFLSSELRKNAHAFPPAEEDSYLIYHYAPVYLGESQLAYYF